MRAWELKTRLNENHSLQNNLSFIGKSIAAVDDISSSLSIKIQAVLLAVLDAANGALESSQRHTDENLIEYVIDDSKDVIKEIKAVIKTLNMTASNKPVIRQLEKQLEDLRIIIDVETAKAHKQGIKKGTEDTLIRIAKLKKEMNVKILKLVAKADGLDPETSLDTAALSKIQQAIYNFLKGLIDSLEERNIDPDTLNKFLDLSIQGAIINMNDLVKKRSGNIDQHINKKLPKKVKDLFDEELRGDIFSFIPGGTTSGNYGPAEVGLAVFGNPAEKADVGDLEINKVMYELKGSGYDNPKKSTGLYGARLNSKGIQPGTSGWDALNAGLLKMMPNLKTKFQGEKGQKNGTGYLTFVNKQISIDKKTGKEITKTKDASRYNFNDRGLGYLNTEILSVVGNRNKTIKFLTGVFRAIVPGYRKVKHFDKYIDNMVEKDGTLILKNVWKWYSAISYDSYNQEDKVKNILFINSSNRNYLIVRNKKELLSAIHRGDIIIKSGITWNDDQQKATPQYCIA